MPQFKLYPHQATSISIKSIPNVATVEQLRWLAHCHREATNTGIRFYLRGELICDIPYMERHGDVAYVRSCDGHYITFDAERMNTRVSGPRADRLPMSVLVICQDATEPDDTRDQVGNNTDINQTDVLIRANRADLQEALDIVCPIGPNGNVLNDPVRSIVKRVFDIMRKDHSVDAKQLLNQQDSERISDLKETVKKFKDGYRSAINMRDNALSELARLRMSGTVSEPKKQVLHEIKSWCDDEANIATGVFQDDTSFSVAVNARRDGNFGEVDMDGCCELVWISDYVADEQHTRKPSFDEVRKLVEKAKQHLEDCDYFAIGYNISTGEFFAIQRPQQ